MKYIRKFEDRLSDSAAYRYIAGALYATALVLKKVAIGFLRHSIEILTAAAFISVLVVTDLFDGGKISFGIVILFLLILTVMVCALIKFKIFRE